MTASLDSIAGDVAAEGVFGGTAGRINLPPVRGTALGAHPPPTKGRGVATSIDAGARRLLGDDLQRVRPATHSLGRELHQLTTVLAHGGMPPVPELLDSPYRQVAETDERQQPHEIRKRRL